MTILGLILTFLGGGALTTILAFLLDLKKENATSKDDLIKDIYKELGRIKQELKEVKDEKQTIQTENFRLKEVNMRLEVQFEDVRNDYKDLLVKYEEMKELNREQTRLINDLRSKLDELMKTKGE